jgi:AraC family transcriptional regulator
MNKPYDLFEGVLSEIEKGLKDGINEDILADKFYLSSVHLRRLFKFAFRRTIGAYIRSRKLAASVEDLLLTDMSVLQIAVEYGLEYEQSYIRAFKREFGLTPGELRKTGQILKITPPLQLFDSNKLAEGLIFGPDIVIIPQFHVAGKKYKIPFRYEMDLPQWLVSRFIHNEAMKISNAVNPDIRISISSEAGMDADYCYLMPAIQVKSLNGISDDFDHYTFPTSLCANFHFIGPRLSEINMTAADGMFRAIDDFMNDERQKYFLERKKITIDRFFQSGDDDSFTQWEWFAPVTEKTKDDLPKNPVGIIKVYQQKMPTLRFIGKKYTEPFNDSVFDTIRGNLDSWRLNSAFDAIEQQSNKDPKTIYEGGDSYISLMRKKSDWLFEYWLGMFMPEETEVPHGYEMMDFPNATLEVCRVYGKRDLIVNYDSNCRKKLAEDGVYEARETDTRWFFQRFNWRHYFEDDKYGRKILEYCYFL